jgi:hypothetical protein
MQLVVVTTVFEFFPDAPADLDGKVWRHGHVAPVEQGVKISAQKQAVLNPVPAAIRIRLDMGGI